MNIDFQNSQGTFSRWLLQSNYSDSETHYVPKPGSELRMDLIHLSMNAIKQVLQ